MNFLRELDVEAALKDRILVVQGNDYGWLVWFLWLQANSNENEVKNATGEDTYAGLSHKFPRLWFCFLFRLNFKKIAFK